MSAFVNEDVSDNLSVAFDGYRCNGPDFSKVGILEHLVWVDKIMAVSQIPIVLAFLKASCLFVDPKVLMDVFQKAIAKNVES